MSKASDLAYDWLRSRILSGEYAAGAHLKEERIAEESRVSRTPVREALRRLSNEQYVKFIPNQGAFVTDLIAADVDDIFELRAMLEGYSAYRAATRISEEDILELEICADAIEALCLKHTKANHRKTIEHNHRFHTVIIKASGSDRLDKMVSWLVEMPMLLKTIDKYSDEDVVRSNHHHRELISAFKARDSVWAQSVMQTHLRAAHRIFTTGQENN